MIGKIQRDPDRRLFHDLRDISRGYFFFLHFVQRFIHIYLKPCALQLFHHHLFYRIPLKEIGQVLDGTLPLEDAAARQQEALQRQQKQIQAAVEVCANIRKERSEAIDVDSYLERMEHMAKSGSVFARIVDDYKQVAEEERQRQFSFYTDHPVNTAGRFEEELRKWAGEERRKFRMVRPGRYPEFTLDGVSYTAACTVEQDQETKEPRTRIVCSREDDEKVKKEVQKNRRAVFQGIYSIGVNIRRHRFKSILNGMISMMTVVVLVQRIINN